MDNPILNIAFIVSITAFFKKQLGLTGWKTMVGAFIVTLLVAELPIAIDALPVAAPWLEALYYAVVLFLSAAGSVDFITLVRTTNVPPKSGL
jgi:hypothetical protein